MFHRKLQALEYPAANGFDANDQLKYRALVSWLEDQKIRNYKQEQRTELRNSSSSSSDWDKSFKKYLADIPIDTQTSDKNEILDWLLGLAIRLEFSDNVEKYSKTVNEKNDSLAPKMMTANPLDKLDFNSSDFISSVNMLADHFKLTKHPNHLITLEAIASIVKTHYSKDYVKPDSKGKKSFSLDEDNLGFKDLGDPILNKAARILRLLYIEDIRDLQTQINETIVAVQTVTADPKTDTKLGKVGF